MSQSAMSIPLTAVPRTMSFPCQKCWRTIICQRCSIRVGSSPTTSSARSSTAPTTARVCHSSVASPQPWSPGSSVTTRTKIQLRMRALQTCASTAVIFIRAILCALREVTRRLVVDLDRPQLRVDRAADLLVATDRTERAVAAAADERRHVDGVAGGSHGDLRPGGDGVDDRDRAHEAVRV